MTRLEELSAEFSSEEGALSIYEMHELCALQAAEIERLRDEIDRRKGQRRDCQQCGERTPFAGAVYCSEKCAKAAATEAAEEKP